ncbi:expressed unknown protein [Seminavis robusta]|uniref:SET domain-containing protein n=1 Tax=Seminavis robusta TaxID=568900 RepID=A0A9N8HZ39_9STRA|nr:expressed unknown protein [Seminavis robusta]|eukprot:Sro3203_g345180.1 n/a (272) ;mRNA; r:6401-7216
MVVLLTCSCRKRRRAGVLLLLFAVLFSLLCWNVHGEDRYGDDYYVSEEEDEEEPYDDEEDPEYDDMIVGDMWHYFDCSFIFSRPRPVHSETDWKSMRHAYAAVVGLERSNRIADKDGDGFAVPVQARSAGDEKGRGVFVTTAPVPKGQLVWSTSMTARFEKGSEYRAFLAKIRQDFACDVLQWAYVQSISDQSAEVDKPLVSVDLDAGSFINTVTEEDEEPNLGCHEQAALEHKGGCQQNYFALKDIQVGEELLLDYGDFAIREGWEWFGL